MAEIVAKDQLKQYIDRIERLETEKSALLDDIKQVFDEAKAEQDAILELYRQALEV